MAKVTMSDEAHRRFKMAAQADHLTLTGWFELLAGGTAEQRQALCSRLGEVDGWLRGKALVEGGSDGNPV